VGSASTPSPDPCSPIPDPRSLAAECDAHTTTGRPWIFYIDTLGWLYPPGAAQLGVPLERLIVLRGVHGAAALWAAEQVLRCRAVAAMILPVQQLDATAARRLQLAAEHGGGLGLLLRRQAEGVAGATFAATRLRFDSLPMPTSEPHTRVTVLKQRDGRCGEPIVIDTKRNGDVADAWIGSA
jgi:hypothetical protein